MMTFRSQLIILVLLFLVTRFGMLANFPHFYDSPEYVRLAQTETFWAALRASHESLHPIYLYLIQVFYDVFGSILGISAVSALFGLLSMTGFVWLLAELGLKKQIPQALLLLLIFPAIWLVQTNVMHESVGHALLLLAAASLMRWISYQRWYWGLLAGLFLAIAYFNYVGLVLWIPALLVLVWWRFPDLDRKTWIRITLGVVCSLALGQIGLQSIMSAAGINQASRFGYIFTRELPQIMQLLSPLGMARIMRNVFFMIVFGYSPLLLILLIRRWQLRSVVLLVVTLVSLLASMSFWHGGLYGRLGSLIGFFLAGIAATFPLRSWKYQLIFWSCLMLFIQSVGVYSSKPKALAQYEQLRANKEGLVVISDNQRPQLEYLGLENYQVVSPQNVVEATRRIDSALEKNQRVLITKQAISAPYWQYDGQHIHIISKGSYTGILSDYLKHRDLHRLTTDDGLLAVYELLVQ